MSDVTFIYLRVLTASYGTASNVTRNFFDPASRLWDAAAALVAPLFEGGTLRARKNAAEAAYKAVFATYQATVLNAFRNVADVLRALHHDAAFLDAQAQAQDAAQAALKLVKTQYRAGQVDFTQVLVSETAFEQARMAYIRAQAQRYADSAALYIALGGGDWHAAAAGDSGELSTQSVTSAGWAPAAHVPIGAVAARQKN